MFVLEPPTLSGSDAPQPQLNSASYTGAPQPALPQHQAAAQQPRLGISSDVAVQSISNGRPLGANTATPAKREADVPASTDQAEDMELDTQSQQVCLPACSTGSKCPVVADTLHQ